MRQAVKRFIDRVMARLGGRERVIDIFQAGIPIKQHRPAFKPNSAVEDSNQMVLHFRMSDCRHELFF